MVSYRGWTKHDSSLHDRGVPSERSAEKAHHSLMRFMQQAYGPASYDTFGLGKLKRPHPTSPKMVVYIGNSTNMSLNRGLKLF